MKHLTLLYLTFLLLIITPVYGQKLTSGAIEEFIEKREPGLPPVEALINERLSDAWMCVDGAGQYYLTGSLSRSDKRLNGLIIWQSSDLKTWKLLGDIGFVWTVERNGSPWLKTLLEETGSSSDFLSLPRIYYFHGTFWMTCTIEPLGSVLLLRSTSGRANGPYQEVRNEEPFLKSRCATFLETPDSTVWCIWGNGYAQKTGFEDGVRLVGSPIRLNLPIDELSDRFSLSVIEGKTYLIFPRWTIDGVERLQSGHLNAGLFPNARYDAMYMVASSVTGTFSMPRLFLPHGGACQLIEDHTGQIRAIVSNNSDTSSPFRGNACAIALESSEPLWLKPRQSSTSLPDSTVQVIYVSKEGDNTTGKSWQSAYQTVQKALESSGNNTQIWISKGSYDGPIKITLKNGICLYGGFCGNETSLWQRDPVKYRVFLEGNRTIPHVVFISGSSYIRLDGLTIKGGNASGTSLNNRYGGGLNLLGGGETIHLINCQFEDNSADQDGGAIYASLGASPIIINCTFRNNTAKNNGGALALYANSYSGYHPQLYNCFLQNNTAGFNGGALLFDTDQFNAGLLSLVNCIFFRNSTSGPYGNIALDRNSCLSMLNCVAAFNSGPSDGAALIRLGRIPARHRIVNSIFYQNEGGHLLNIEGDVFYDGRKEQPWLLIENCLLNSNTTEALVFRNFDGKSWKTVTELNESLMGRENLDADPLFVDPYRGDFHLLPDSEGRGNGTSIGIAPFTFDGSLRLSGTSFSEVDMGIF